MIYKIIAVIICIDAIALFLLGFIAVHYAIYCMIKDWWKERHHP